ncbi:MAG: LysR family transcriptional regulator [Polyangiaceae bacterium]
MLVDLESLRCFLAAAQHLNFREAARQVALSPAAFGDRIKRLEEQLDAKLFERTTRRVTLTPAGERLSPHAREVMGLAARCRDVALADDRPTPYGLTVGTRFELGLSWLTPALTSLAEAHPERELHLAFGDTTSLLEALRRHDVDCLVTSARITRGGLVYARLHEERYAFVATRKTLDRAPLKRARDAGDHVLLELDKSLPLFRYFLDARPGEEVWAFARTQYLGTIGAVRSRALAHAGVAVLPRYFVAEDLARKRLVELFPKVALPIDWFRLIWSEEHPRQAELRQLAGELTELPLR